MTVKINIQIKSFDLNKIGWRCSPLGSHLNRYRGSSFVMQGGGRVISSSTHGSYALCVEKCVKHHNSIVLLEILAVTVPNWTFTCTQTFIIIHIYTFQQRAVRGGR